MSRSGPTALSGRMSRSARGYVDWPACRHQWTDPHRARQPHLPYLSRWAKRRSIWTTRASPRASTSATATLSVSTVPSTAARCRGGVTRLGHDNLSWRIAIFAHDCQVGNYIIFANCASLAGHVSVGDYAVLGGFTVAHQFAASAPLHDGAVAITFMDIPPYVIAWAIPPNRTALNLRGLKRHGFTDSEAIEPLRRAYKVLYKSKPCTAEAIERLEKLASAKEVSDFAFLSVIPSAASILYLQQRQDACINCCP